ncbi:unnamed protein product, partial (macronuclear) [Paramecium tetraurelia]
IFKKLLFPLTNLFKNKGKNKKRKVIFFKIQKTLFLGRLITSHFKIIKLFLLLQLQLNSQDILKHNQSYFRCSHFFNLTYLILFRPVKSNFEQAKLICREVILLINTGSFLVYSLELNDEEYIIYGWINIGLFSFLIAFSLVVDIFEQAKIAYSNHLKKEKMKEKMRIMRYFYNPLQKFIDLKNFDIEKKK